jgi:Terminase large subunit, T4likevirus-type, N-terminal
MPDYFDSACATVDLPIKVASAKQPFWSMSRPYLEANKLVRGGMWEHQQNWWELPNFIKLLVGGYGCGKTYLLCKRAIAACLQNAPCPVATVSPSFPIARKTIIPTIHALLAGKKSLLGSAFWYRYNKSVHEFYIRYHGREGLIMVLSGDDPNSLRGPNLADAYIDEPFIQEQEVFDQMIARVRHPDAVFRELGLTGTPESLNWGYDLCVGDLREKNDVGFIKASSRQNLVLDSGYVPRLEGVLSAKAARAYVEGDFVSLAEGLVYYGFDNTPDKNVVDLPMPQYPELGCGMDFNVNPMAACLFWRNGSHLHYFDEIELPNADTEYMCSTLKEKYCIKGEEMEKRYGVNGQMVLQNIYPDATGSAHKTSAPGGRTDFYYIREAGFVVNAKHENPKRRDRYNTVNGRLAPKQGPRQITVSPKCKRLIKYLSTYSHELIREQEAMSHLLDAFSYPVSYLFPAGREVVQVGKLLT